MPHTGNTGANGGTWVRMAPPWLVGPALRIFQDAFPLKSCGSDLAEVALGTRQAWRLVMTTAWRRRQRDGKSSKLVVKMDVPDSAKTRHVEGTSPSQCPVPRTL
jgi:hypothetical protein